MRPRKNGQIARKTVEPNAVDGRTLIARIRVSLAYGGSSIGKVAMFQNLAVTDDRRDRTSEAQHIADILPLVLAKYATQETQIIPRVEFKPSHIMPSHCVSV